MAEGLGQSIDKLSLVVASPQFEKVHYAFVMAAGAAALGTPVTMFFTMAACNAILDKEGWQTLPSEKPDTTAKERNEDFAAKGVATMDELIDSCSELGVKFIVCEMGLWVEGLEDRKLRNGLTVTRAGVATFFNDASPAGAIVYI